MTALTSYEGKTWPEIAEDLSKLFEYYPVPPFTALPYDAVRGISWHVYDGNMRCIALVFEEEAVRLLLQRLNT